MTENDADLPQLSEFERSALDYFVDQFVAAARFAPQASRDEPPRSEEQIRQTAQKRVLRRLSVYVDAYRRRAEEGTLDAPSPSERGPGLNR